MNGQFSYFTVVKRLYSGQHSAVYQVRMDDETIAAVKAVKLSLNEGLREKQMEQLDERIGQITALHHPNVVRHFHMAYTGKYAPVRIPRYYIVMELCKGKVSSRQTFENCFNGYRQNSLLIVFFCQKIYSKCKQAA